VSREVPLFLELMENITRNGRQLRKLQVIGDSPLKMDGTVSSKSQILNPYFKHLDEIFHREQLISSLIAKNVDILRYHRTLNIFKLGA